MNDEVKQESPITVFCPQCYSHFLLTYNGTQLRAEEIFIHVVARQAMTSLQGQPLSKCHIYTMMPSARRLLSPHFHSSVVSSMFSPTLMDFDMLRNHETPSRNRRH